MSSQPKPLPMLVAASLVAAVGSARAQDVKVCTFAGGPTHAVDTAVTRAVFTKLGLSWKEVDASEESNDEGLTSAHAVGALLKSRCDVFAGLPLSGKDVQYGQGLSAPYLEADFVRFSLPTPPSTHGEAVAYESPGQIIAAQEHDTDFQVFNTSDEVIAAVVDGKVGQGITWYPSLVAYQQAHPGVHFHVEKSNSALAAWQVSFVAAPRNRALMERIRGAIHDLDTAGDLRRATATLAMEHTAWNRASTGAVRPASFHAGHGWRLLRVADATTPTAPFTTAQAAQGAKDYAAECAMCHGDKLEGRTAPALVGQGFAASSNSGMTVSGIWQYMTTNMPAQKPGKLEPKEYADIMAFLLSVNGYQPSGNTLTADAAGNDDAEFDSFVK